MLVDSHCHLDRLNYESLHQNPQEVVDKAKARGVDHLLCVSVSLNDYELMRDKLQGIDHLSFSCGVHPLDAQDHVMDSKRLQQLSSDPSVVAIGETGLDYFYSPESKAQQMEYFTEHLKVAKELNKPVIIHTCDAREDTLALLHEYANPEVGGVLHCFTEDYEMAMEAIELGFYISASGIISFNSAKAVRETFSRLPLERLLVETDSPYLAPAPYRGEENQPAYVRRVAECLAEIRGISIEALGEVTTANFQKLFNVSKL